MIIYRENSLLPELLLAADLDGLRVGHALVDHLAALGCRTVEGVILM